MEKLRAISVDIYKSKIGDCSNHGISEKFDDILLLCEDGYIDVKGDEPNLCKIVERKVFDHRYLHIEPVAKPNGIGWMAGGCLVYSCDSRFRTKSEYPLCLHDRCESQELYNKLSV